MKDELTIPLDDIMAANARHDAKSALKTDPAWVPALPGFVDPSDLGKLAMESTRLRIWEFHRGEAQPE